MSIPLIPTPAAQQKKKIHPFPLPFAATQPTHDD